MEVGISGHRRNDPTLDDWFWTPAGPSPPTVLSVKDAQQGDYNADLVQVEARLLDQFTTPKEFILELQENGTIFHAHLSRPNLAKPLKLLNGSRLRLTGICLAQFIVPLYGQRLPQGFRLLLRSPQDIAILQHPSWLTLEHAQWILLAMTMVLVPAILWAVTLRRRIAQQKEIIRQNIQREAVHEERSRIAQDFHDSFEQHLVGIRLQLEVIEAQMADAPQNARRDLQVVQSLVRHSQTEARASIWNLRAQSLGTGSLALALKEMVGYARNGFPREIEIAVSGDPFALPATVESHLLRVAQEATTNAIKHAGAQNIGIQLCYAREKVSLRISDDGCGFDSQAAGPTGHFGLQGMRERAARIGGQMQLTTHRGAGTVVEVSVATKMIPIQLDD